MRTSMILAFLLALPASTAFAQEDFERRMEELKRWYEGTRREAEQQFRAQMEKLERTFHEKAEHLKREFTERHERRKEGPHEGPPPKGEGLERMVRELFNAVERLQGELRELRGELDRMRRGGGERERAVPPARPPRAPQPPRPPRGEKREPPEKPRDLGEHMREFGEQFRRMFREGEFNWREFSQRMPKEFHEWGPDRWHELFKRHRDWFPEEFDHERWFQGLEKWFQHRRELEKPERKKLEKKEKHDGDEDDDRQQY